MQRTISAMVGKGSVNHNSRKFRAENVDGSVLRYGAPAFAGVLWLWL